MGVRRILGVLVLAKKFGNAAVEKACTAALELGVPEYRFVRRYPERCPAAPLTLHQVDPLIRELVHYRDLIQQRLQEQEMQGSHGWPSKARKSRFHPNNSARQNARSK